MPEPINYTLRCVNEFIKSDKCISNLEHYVNGLEISANGKPVMYLYAPLKVEVSGGSVIITDLHGRSFTLNPLETSEHSTLFSLKNFIVTCNCNCPADEIEPPVVLARELQFGSPDDFDLEITHLGVICNTSVSSVVVFLPSAASAINLPFYIKNDDGLNIVRVTPEGVETIDNAAFYDTTGSEGITIISDGLEWHIVGSTN